MARIVVNSYMVRYPLGGMMSWVLQYLVGFHRMGHEVYFVEKSGYPSDCYDAERDIMTDDCKYGVGVVDELLARFGLDERWCFVDAGGEHHGLSERQLSRAFEAADLYIDMGTRGDWTEEAEASGARVFVDGEPGYCQIRMEKALAAGQESPRFDHYYSTGRNIGTAKASAPTAGKRWRPIFHPVNVELFENRPPPAGAGYTTVMNWQSHPPLEFEGRVYGQKDLEFEKFVSLPGATNASLELAVSGERVPSGRLLDAGWKLRDSHEVTASYDSFIDYIRSSRGEFSVAKNVFVATRSGWFSDRSAAYLASGRPVVMQDTGFSSHLPCGEGLFAIDSAEEAAEALDQIEADYPRHRAAAREVAAEHLDAPKVLARLLEEVGL
jgi:hypothetical protein